MTSQIRFVLCEPTHPGNIGAAARAMKTMGFEDLVLVRPRHFPSAEADARASGALNVLTGATVVDDLAEAVADCAVRVAPVAILEVARIGLAVLALAVFLALVGAAGTAFGWHRLRVARPTVVGRRVGLASRADQLALGLLACGMALMMPAMWLAASFAASIAT